MIRYSIDTLFVPTIGRLADGGVQRIEFDCARWLRDYPALTDYRLEVTSPDGVVYLPEHVEMKDGILIWHIKQSDTASVGKGAYQIVATGAEGEKKTSDHRQIIILDVMPGTAGDTPPDPSKGWVDKVAEASAKAQSSAQTAVNTAKRAEDALAGLTPRTQESITAIEKAGAEQAETVKTEGAAQVQAVKDAGAEQSAALAAQEERLNQAVQGTVEAVVAEGEKQNTAIVKAAEAKKQEAIDAVNQVGAQQISAVESAGKEKADAITNEGRRVLDSIPADYPESIAAAQIELVDKLCPPFESSGSIVQCRPVEGYALHVVSRIEPVQEGEGDPSPENVRAITGWKGAELSLNGKNLFDGRFYMLGFAMGAGIGELVMLEGCKISITPIKGGSTYTVSRDAISGNRFRVGYTKEYPREGATVYNLTGDLPTDSNLFFTTVAPDDCNYLVVYFANDGTEITGNIQIELGDTVTGYEPYKGNTYTAQFPETVYGGTLDWKTGVLTVDRFAHTLTGAEKILQQDIEIEDASGFYCNIQSNNWPTAKTENDATKRVICTHFRSAQSGAEGDMNTASLDFTFRNLLINVESSVCGSTINEFVEYIKAQKAAGTPITVSYEMAKPYTIQLTPQQIAALSGVNTLWSDTGDTAVSGRADPVYINQTMLERIAALEDAIVNA